MFRAPTRIARHWSEAVQKRRLLTGTHVSLAKNQTSRGETSPPATDNASEDVKPTNVPDPELNDETDAEMVDMWNNEAPGGPEWNGPRGYEPTRYGDWSKNGRVTDF